MSSHVDSVAEKFLRNYCKIFSVRDMEKVFARAGIRASSKDTVAYLESSPLVFCLEGNKYVTKAGAFTGELFSIRPTPQEYEQRVLVVGDRCLPFVDSDMFSSSLSFFINGTKLGTRVGTFDSDLAIDMFMLFGEEYAPQYIAADPANADSGLLQNDFELPNNVRLTGVDMRPLVAKGLRKGDRLLCYVEDWNLGKISVAILNDGDNAFNCGEEGERRLLWYQNLEEALLESFDKAGPCGTIEEQLSLVFFEERERLCLPICGSMEEFLNRYARKVGIEQFGVETRLWYKGKSVPAVGSWNKDDIADLEFSSKANGSFDGSSVYFTVQPVVYEQYMVDMYYHHKERDSLETVIQKIFPSDYVFHRGEKAFVMLNLTERHAILKKQYNWFSDQTAGPIRERALELYTKVSAMMYRIDCCSASLKDFPQQELVILSQLYSHLLRMLDSLSSGERLEEDADSMMVSLEGMRWNFEDIEEILLGAIEEHHCNKFKVIK